MHIPDGILPLEHSLVYIAISGIIILIAIWQSKKSLTLKQIPIVGVLGAGLFAAQMFNFPVPFGSSGHLIGTALATSLLGPWVAMLILAAILIIQALFGDGGFLAFGANFLNMAIIGAFTTFLLFVIIPKKWRQRKEIFAVFAGVSGFITTVMMAFVASIELVIAQIGPSAIVFGWMLALHAIIGLIEGVITFALIMFVFKADASLFKAAEDSLFMKATFEAEKNVEPQYRFPVWAAVSTIGVFGIMSIFGLVASEQPDGLERTFEFIEAAGFDLFAQETGLFGFPEGLGWAILQMAIIMILIFIVILVVNFIIFLVQRRKFIKHQTEINDDQESFDDQNIDSGLNLDSNKKSEYNECNDDTPERLVVQ